MTTDQPSAPGTLHLDGEVTTMTFVRRLPHPVTEVWAALTDPAERAAWLGPTKIDGRAGGSVETVADGPPVPDEIKRMTGEILVWDPPHVYVHEWHVAVVEPGVVRYEHVADGEHTVLTFTHRGLGARNAEGFIPGTHAYLDRLAAALAGDTPPEWGQRYGEVAGLYAPG
jgi:uncharacterized protein YndB with AHSA1/START domain